MQNLTETLRMYILQSYNSKWKTFQLPNIILELSIIIESKKFKIQLYDKWNAFPFSIVSLPHFDSNIPSNIYYASIRSETLGFCQNYFKHIFATLCDCFLKRMQKQGRKKRSTIYMLNKVLHKNFAVFKVFADIAESFIKFFSLPWIRTLHMHGCLLHSLLLLFFYCLLVYLQFCLFTIASVSSIFVSIYLNLFMFLWIGILCYNFTIN